MRTFPKNTLLTDILKPEKKSLLHTLWSHVKTEKFIQIKVCKMIMKRRKNNLSLLRILVIVTSNCY